MMKAVPFLIAALLAFASPAIAQDKPSAPGVCQTTTDEMIEKLDGASLFADLKGDDLTKFNDNYTADTGRAAPSTDYIDRLTVFASKQNPDSEVLLALGSKGDCVVAMQPMPKQLFEQYRAGKPGVKI